MSVGGLNGEFQATYDLQTGRSTRQHQLGSIAGAGGYDGQVAWQRGPAGEIAMLDACEAQRRARSQAWLDARGYWYPQRFSAAWGSVRDCELAGIAYRVVEVVPQEGEALALWFAAADGLLKRIVRRRGADAAITLLADYRDVDGVLLPFQLIAERVDASGDSDPRQRMLIELDQVILNVSVAEADFAIPSMTSSARIDDASGVTRVPFALINNHIYLDGEIDGQPVRFMVDTGGVNLLTPHAARRLGLSGEGKLAASGPGEQRVDVAMAHAKQVRLGAATLDRPVFYIVDLGKLPQAEGVELDGLIGYEMFRRFGIEIDYAAGELKLVEPGRFVPPTGAEVFALEFERLTPIISATLDDVPMRLSVDTGSRASLTLFSPFVLAHDLVAKYQALPESILGWGVGGGVQMRSARFGRLQLGKLTVDAIAGDLFTGTKGALTQSGYAGNLGGGVLRRFTVAFDYAARRMYLKPNANYGLPDSFDRSGLWLLQDGGVLKVADVASGSAAEQAGIVAGDRIVSVEAIAVKTQSLAFWRKQLRDLPAGIELAVNLLRDDRALPVRLILADRIATGLPRSAG
jgi:Aspartyl protease